MGFHWCFPLLHFSTLCIVSPPTAPPSATASCGAAPGYSHARAPPIPLLCSPAQGCDAESYHDSASDVGDNSLIVDNSPQCRQL